MTPTRDVVIVGASAAGLRCACRLARLRPTWRVTVVETRASFSFAACGLPYVLSGDVDDLSALRRTADGALRDEAYFEAVKGIEVRAGRTAVSIDADSHALHLVSAAGEAEQVRWDDLVLATGARPRRLPGQPLHPRVQCLHVPEDVASLRRGLESGVLGHVAVVGAGLVGCELAEAFRALWGADVSLVEAGSHPLPALVDPAVGEVVAAALRSNGVRLSCGEPVVRLEAGDSGAAVITGNGRVEADAVVVAVGVDPAVELARTAGIALGPHGGVLVDERLATSVPGVWAAGDCVEVRHAVLGIPVCMPLGSVANRQGRTLANVLAGRTDRFPALAGAMAVKVFDCNVAATGCTLAAALAHGFDAGAAWVTSHDRAHYWPEAADIGIQVVYERGSLRLLGVQAVGAGEVVKRVDVATQLLVRGAVLHELGHLEHAYAPPYAPALDPLAVAAFAALNQEDDGLTAAAPLAELGERAVLDVRHADERVERPFAEAASFAVPLEELRDGDDVPAGEDLLIVCERGARSAEAARRLSRQGRTVTYLGGGLRWRGRLAWEKTP